MVQLLPLSQCLKLLGVPIETWREYKARMPRPIPFKVIDCMGHVNPNDVKRLLIEAGYSFEKQSPEQ
ncbi:MAG: hypothetical protein JOZ18_16785 [Chloroflexi bacterium]|nr:hypothetical protein [Chloroflexota bacterium]